MGLWATSLRSFRRSRYATFFKAHQLHFLFVGFGAIHWPTIVPFASPLVLFYSSDFALAQHRGRSRVGAAARAHFVRAPRRQPPPAPPATDGWWGGAWRALCGGRGGRAGVMSVGEVAPAEVDLEGICTAAGAGAPALHGKGREEGPPLQRRVVMSTLVVPLPRGRSPAGPAARVG